jgi:hypothetical protein
MSDEEIETLAPGERVYSYWDTGALGASAMIMTVVRVNRLTVTVDYRGQRVRCPRSSLVGRWTESD